MFIFIINQIIPINKSSANPYSRRLFLIYFAVTLVITIYTIFKTRKLEKKDILIGILFGIIVGINHILVGFITTIAYIGLRCMFKYSGVDVPIFKDKSFKGIMKSTIIATICGGVLGIINLLLGMSQNIPWQPYEL